MKRGFKTWCETTAAEYRRQLKLSEIASLDPFKLAQQLRVALKTPNDFPKLPTDVRERLLTVHSDCWSAFTVSGTGRRLIVYNPTHSAGRTSSNIMHELAHIILGHKPAKMFMSSIGIPLRTFDPSQEEEATWLSGCLLLPRVALVRIKNRRIDLEQSANDYGVSGEMLRYRLQVTGVNKMWA